MVQGNRIRPDLEVVKAHVADTATRNRAAVRSNGPPAFVPAFAAAPLRRGYEMQLGGGVRLRSLRELRRDSLRLSDTRLAWAAEPP